MRVLSMMKFDDKDFIAQQIRFHRKKMGLTQEELAEKVELSVQHISRIETGYYIPSLKTFFMLASVLNLDLKAFGYMLEVSTNPRKNKIIKNVANATDAELIFYENLMQAVTESLAKIKAEIL